MDLTLEQRVAVVRENIDRAAAGRPVTLVGVAKTKPAELVVRAVRAGIGAIGENYVQEFREKSAAGAYAGAAVQSVDSAALLQTISKRAASLGAVQDVLIEVNIGGEAEKSGCAPQALEELLAGASALPGIRVRGLMAIPPAEDTRAYFGPMYNLFVDIAAKKYDNVSMDFLSMGMSDDYEDAIRQGANMVRVGSFIFGPRNYI